MPQRLKVREVCRVFTAASLGAYEILMWRSSYDFIVPTVLFFYLFSMFDTDAL